MHQLALFLLLLLLMSAEKHLNLFSQLQKKHYQTNTTKQIKQFIFINANKTKDCSPQANRICVCLSVSTKL